MKYNTSRRVQSRSLVAPVGGLNDRDSIANMGEQYALIMDNLFPTPRSIRARGGSIESCSGLPAIGETLMPYNGLTKTLFCASGTAIYDVSTGTTASSVVSGKTNARWDHVNFANIGGKYLVAVNGSDLPMFYNGSAWTPSGTGYATAITDVSGLLTSPNKFSQVSVWKNRLFFVEKNSLRFWYLGVGAIGGAAAYIDLGGVAKLGGTIIATATISSSAGVTPDDYFVALTSEGECIVYRGTDPSNASTFALVGNYRIGRPIANGNNNQGGRFLARFGTDVVAITADGFITLQDMINSDVVAQRKTISDIIVNTVTDDVSSYAANFGWQVVLAPMQNMLIINVPQVENTTSIQYVMNTITGAWCRFTGLNASCFQVFGDDIYACMGTSVFKVDIDQSNDLVTNSFTGNPIFLDCKTAYVYYSGGSSLNSFKMVRPLIYATGDILPLCNIDVDFKQNVVSGTVNIVNSSLAKWDSALWDSATWGADSVLYSNWLSVNGLGYCASLRLQLYASSSDVEWQGYIMQYETAGLI